MSIKIRDLYKILAEDTVEEISAMQPEELAKQAIPELKTDKKYSAQKNELLQKLENAAARIASTTSRYNLIKKEVETGLSKNYYPCCIDILHEYNDAIETEQNMAKDTDRKISELKEKISSIDQADCDNTEADVERILSMVEITEETYRDIGKNIKLNRFEAEEEGDWFSNFLAGPPDQRHRFRNRVFGFLLKGTGKVHIGPYDQIST